MLKVLFLICHMEYESGYNDQFQVPRGHVWIEGDNKEGSKDSRIYGPVPYGLIQYRLLKEVEFVVDVQLLPLEKEIDRMDLLTIGT